MRRAIEQRDPTREVLPDAKVSRAPCNFVAKDKEPARDVADDAFACCAGRVHVSIDAPRKVEAQ
jgi:hypothetical protein